MLFNMLDNWRSFPSRRLRDGVSPLENEADSSGTAPAATNLLQSWIACRSKTRRRKTTRLSY